MIPYPTAEDLRLFYDAAVSGNNQAIAQYLDKYGDKIIDRADDEHFMPALLWAAVRGCTDTVKLLLERGANVDIEDDTRRTALMIAAYQGHPKTVNLLLECGADINKQNKNGRTALIEASSCGQSDIIALLLEKGALPNVKDKQGRHALMYCAMHGNTEGVRLLIGKGSSLDDIDDYKDTAVSWAKKLDFQSTAAFIADAIALQKKKQEQEAQNRVAASVAETQIESLQKLRPAKPLLKKCPGTWRKAPNVQKQ